MYLLVINRRKKNPVITFIRYTQNQKIGKPNNLKFWEQYNQRAKTG
jgi:hypothetical protein